MAGLVLQKVAPGISGKVESSRSCKLALYINVSGEGFPSPSRRIRNGFPQGIFGRDSQKNRAPSKGLHLTRFHKHLGHGPGGDPASPRAGRVGRSPALTEPSPRWWKTTRNTDVFIDSKDSWELLREQCGSPTRPQRSPQQKLQLKT